MAEQQRKRLTGLLCGLAAAIGYTLANIALRYSARPGDFDWAVWVTVHKAVPATLLTWGLVLRNVYLGRPALPDRHLILLMVATGLMMQFGGNIPMQWALGTIGLAMTVPITFAFILISGAVFSRFFLGESITPRMVLALLTLIIAVSLLSIGAGEASRQIFQASSFLAVAVGFGMAVLAGVSFGICGVVIRRQVRNLPVSGTLVLLSTVSLVGGGVLVLTRMPWEALMATTPTEVLVMQLAGVFNAAAFYSIGIALSCLQVNQVNMINTTQIAMATVAGVLFFAEPLTTWLVSGVLLTIIGLYLMDRQ